MSESARPVSVDRAVPGDARPALAQSETRIEDILETDGLFVSTTVGVSMWPLLRNRRDTIVVAAVPEDRRDGLRVGDVALYRADGRYVLHRVIGFWPDGAYMIRGDNTLAAEHVEPAQVIGVLAEIYRRRGPARVGDDRTLHIDCAASRGYRRYWRIWLAIWPVRRVAKVLRLAAGRLARRALAPFGWRGRHPNGY